MCLRWESNPGPPAHRRRLYAKNHSYNITNCYSEPRLVLTQIPPKPWCRKLFEIRDREWVWLFGHVEVRIAGEGARRSNLRRLRENCITLGSPLYRGLNRATYILCIEHLRLMQLSRESNPGPPALSKEPFKRRYWLLFGTSTCTTVHYTYTIFSPFWSG
jgi:hypothetical protein